VPAVSVIVPVHNADLYLHQSLESLLVQTFTDLEIICVDDGSTDGSRGILEDFRSRDPRIRVVDGPAIGSAGAARNAGLDVATGDYLSFVDADDYFTPAMYAELVKVARKHGADAVVTKYRTYDERTRDVVPVDWALQLGNLPAARPFAARDAAEQLFLAINPAPWNKLFSAELIRSNGLRFQHLRRTNDAFFTYMALAHAERIATSNKYLITYRTGNQASLQGSREKSPLDFVDAIAAMHDHLEASGLYRTFEQAFVNRALDLCLFNLRNAGTPESFLTIRSALVDDVLDRFGIRDRPAGYLLRKPLVQGLADLQTLTPIEHVFGWMKAAEFDLAVARSETRQALRAASVMGMTTTIEPVPASAPVPQASSATDRPDVSVVIPAFNVESFVREAVASAQRQEGVSLQIIAVDDGSTDATPEILDALAAADERVTVIHQPNAGLSMARNAGIAVATGRYLAFLDGDDRWLPSGLADLVAHADNDRLDALLFDGESFRDPGVDDRTWARFDGYYTRPAGLEAVVSGPDLLTAMVDGLHYRPNAYLYLLRRDLLDEARLRFYPGITHEDNLFTFSMLIAASRAAHLPVRLYNRRVRPGSIMTAGSRMASARGFFISYLEMQRLVAGRTFSEPVAHGIGTVIYSMFRHCRDNFVKLNADQANQFRKIDPSPEAQTLLLLLKRAYREAQSARPAAATPPLPRPLPRRVLSRAKGYLKRLLGR